MSRQVERGFHRMPPPHIGLRVCFRFFRRNLCRLTINQLVGCETGCPTVDGRLEVAFLQYQEHRGFGVKTPLCRLNRDLNRLNPTAPILSLIGCRPPGWVHGASWLGRMLVTMTHSAPTRPVGHSFTERQILYLRHCTVTTVLTPTIGQPHGLIRVRCSERRRRLRRG